MYNKASASYSSFSFFLLSDWETRRRRNVIKSRPTVAGIGSWDSEFERFTCPELIFAISDCYFQNINYTNF
jgi:hypothetical protein